MKKKYYITLTILLILHFSLEFFYRPMFLGSNTFDFYLAGSFTNFTSVVGIACLMVIFDKDLFYTTDATKHLIYIIPALSMIMYEVIQIFMPNQTFTIPDIIYSLIGGLAIFLIQRFYWDNEKKTI